MQKSRIIAGAVIVALIGGAVAAFAVAWRPAIDQINPPAPQSCDPALVKRGRDLAAIGNCSDCHTAPGGKTLAGGLAVPTPFGAIYSSNITPDPDSGIGRWSEAAFQRAMRSGVDRGGHHLYPTFPYDHFTNVSDEDDHALYAFLMTRTAVRAPAHANDLAFPFNQRLAVAGWKLLFLKGGTYKADSSQSAQWNRGAYLVEGLAHCGACHTPRNALGAERTNASFSGGDVDNWHAYAINAQSPSPLPWTADALFHYLRYGWDSDHGVARGPMAEVTANLSSVPESDVRAIAVYMTSVFGTRASATPADLKSSSDKSAPADNSGASIYQAACATCHEADRPLPYSGINLRLSTALSAPDPRNAANVILGGIRPVGGERSPIMPGFANSMTDEQIAALLTYLRGRFSAQPAWSNAEQIVRDARRAETVSLQSPSAPNSPPAGSTQRDKP
ncbi:c-type cytochrome [Bradyrhizobium erythrophlei]|uniref:Cytochrome c, mono-and diheme variants n=1 Tax=Bradyrhizobium erythrophlei TaxID=1437360 RepID=A0A1M7TPU2_9BRAD|nr:cytochrome c [Bradyrhizobium erythrophlei]SHN72764.1 Cytochrome c, mono-and diheme variants [Bradyrhizobium erythrophlei]